MEKYADSIKSRDLSQILSENFTMFNCNWSVRLGRDEILHRLTRAVPNITTRRFNIVGVSSSENVTLDHFSAQILPYISVNQYEVRWIDDERWEIVSELHNECRVQPITSALINDDRLMADLSGLELQGHVEPISEDRVLTFNVRVNQTVKKYHAMYCDDQKYLVDQDFYEFVDPTYLSQLFRIAEFTASRSVFDEIVANKITLTKCGDHRENLSRDDFYSRLLTRQVFAFNEHYSRIAAIRKYSNKTMQFLMRVNEAAVAKIVVDATRKIAEMHFTCDTRFYNVTRRDSQKRHGLANVTRIAEELIFEFYKAIRTSDEKLMGETISPNFEIRKGPCGRRVNSTQILNFHPQNFPFLNVIGAHQWDNGTLFIRTMGTGIQNYYQTVKIDGKQYIEYEERHTSINKLRLDWFNYIVKMRQ